MANEDSPKVFISVDMEGITGVTHWDEVDSSHRNYEHFRSLMIDEANAAIDGALDAGATQIVVRDSHDTARNLLPGKLRPEAKLIREWAGSPFGMMQGIDESFDAVVFVGYHAQAGTPNATLKHTMSGKIYDLRINGEAVPEAGWNALIAGYYRVPVVFLSGDAAICEYAKFNFTRVETVSVKEGIGKACISLSPKKTVPIIREGVKNAVKNRNNCQPFTPDDSCFTEIQYAKEEKANEAQWYPGAERVDNRTVGFRSDDFLECMRFFMFAH